MYLAWANVIEETAKKISCLLKKSVTHGANVYRKLLKEGDVQGRIFGTKFKMLPSEIDIALLDARMNQAVAANPDIIMYLDTFKILRIAREDVKLAEQYYKIAMKKMLQSKLQQAKDNQDATFNAQRESAIVGEQEKGKNMAMKLKMEGKQSEMQGKVDKEKIVLTGVFELAKLMAAPQTVGADGQTTKPGSLPPSLVELMELSIKNIAIPLAMDTAEMVNGMEDEEEPLEETEQMPQQQNQQQVA
jgi:hypothetical protein